MNVLHELLAKNIKLYRAQSNMTQEILAEKVALSTPYLGEIETGRKYPSSDVFLRLAIALGVKPYQLLMEHPFYASAEELNKGDDIRGILAREFNAMLDKHFLPSEPPDRKDQP